MVEPIVKLFHKNTGTRFLHFLKWVRKIRKMKRRHETETNYSFCICTYVWYVCFFPSIHDVVAAVSMSPQIGIVALDPNRKD